MFGHERAVTGITSIIIGGRPAACVALITLVAMPVAVGSSPVVVQEQPDTTDAAPAPAAADAASDTVPTGPEIESVRFSGATALDAERIGAAIETRASSCRSPLYVLFCAIGDWDWAEDEAYLDPEVVAGDEERIEALYEVWGYPDARVASRVIAEGDDDDVVVEFRIEEGEPIRVASVEVVGLDRLDPPVELVMPLPLEVGAPYALPRLDATQERIREAFAERGRPYARIDVGGDVDEAARAASIVLEIEPGPEADFGAVTVQAEPPIEEDVVRERLAYEPGDPYRPSSLEETERALARLPIVERAVVDPATTDEPDTVIATTVIVAARDPQGIQVEGSVSSTECLEAAAFWNDRYFLGEPRTFSIGAGLSNLLARQADGFPCTDAGEERFAVVNYFVRAELRQPWPGSPRTDVLGSVFAHRESAPNAFVQTGYGARLGVARVLRPRLTATLAYEPARSELDAAGFFFCGNYGVCSAEGVEELSEFNWLSPVELFALRAPEGGFGELRRPDRDRVPWEGVPGPARRWWIRAGIEAAHALTGSDFEYARTVNEAALTRQLGERYEVAGRGRFGLIAGGDALPPQIRLYSGGVSTVRGVGQNLLGPRVLAASPENALELGCEIVVGGCPAGIVIGDDAEDLVRVRPLGGDAVVEANLEGRVWLTETLQAAAFVDFGALGRGVLSDPGDAPFVPDEWDALVTPGVGIRVLTGLAPIRIDLGYDPGDVDDAALFTQDPETGALVPLGRVGFEPYDDGFLASLADRLQLHVAIGQAF